MNCVTSKKRFHLPKTSLIRKSGEYGRVYRGGSRVRGAGFSLVVCKNDLEFNRLGVSIHRHLRGAVKRNRIKRIIREAFRLHRDTFPQQCDIVFAVRPGFLLSSPQDVIDAVTPLIGNNQTN